MAEAMEEDKARRNVMILNVERVNVDLGVGIHMLPYLMERMTVPITSHVATLHVEFVSNKKLPAHTRMVVNLHF